MRRRAGVLLVCAGLLALGCGGGGGEDGGGAAVCDPSCADGSADAGAGQDQADSASASDAGADVNGRDAAQSDDAAPVHGIFNVRTYGARGDANADDAPAIKKTIAAAGAAGGGIVYFPAGKYRIKSGLSVASGVTLAGEGFEPPVSGKLAGSWLVVDAGFMNAPAVTLGGGGATLRDLGIAHEQPAPGPGWAPRAFGWAVDMAVPDTLTRNVWLLNATLGIHGIGRTTIENVQGQPITTGIQIDTAYDVVRIRRVRFNWTADGGPVWSSDPSIVARLGVGFESFRDDNPEIYDVKLAGYATGIHYGASKAGVTSKFSMMDTFVTGSGRCVTIDGLGTTGKIDRLWASKCGATGIWITGASSVLSAADLDIREVGGNAVRVEASGAFALLNQITVVDFDKAGAGFPAVEAANASATAKVGLFHAVNGGAVPFGGVGKVLVDTNGGDSAFDLRIPTPTEVPEDGLAPFAAKLDVLAFGAKGDGTGDDTAAIQAALDAAAKAGGGPVVVPAGDYHLKGSLHVPPKVTLVGVGWQGQAEIDPSNGTIAAGKVLRGAYFSVDRANLGDVVELKDDAGIKMLGFHWDQGPVVAGWQPRAFGWAVRVTGTNAVVRDLFLLNPTKGIEVASAGPGPVLVDRISGSPQAIGLHLDTGAKVRANALHFWPFWGYGGAYGKVASANLEAHAIAFQSDRSVGAEISNAFSIFYQIGVLLGRNAAGQASTDLRLWNADQDVGVRGYVVTGAGTQATFANFNAQGDDSQTSPGVTGIWAEPSAANAQISGYNGDLRIFTGNAVRSDAPGTNIRVNLTRLEAWGRGGPFPPVENGSGGPELWSNGM